MCVVRLLSTFTAFSVLLFAGCGDVKKTQQVSSISSQKKTPFSGEWHSVSADDDKFKVMMPSEPTLLKQARKSFDGEVYKASSGGIFFNFTILTYSEKIVGFDTSDLEKITINLMRKKVGHKQEFLKTIGKKDERPAIEHKYRYPSGQTSTGFLHKSGYAVHQLFAVGNQVCWLFVDVVDEFADSNSDKVDKEIKRFFDSLEIADPLKKSN